MRKFALAVMVSMVFFAASISHAATTCSNEQISTANTEVKIALDPYSSRAIMTVVAKDAQGEILCSLNSLWTSTSRNMPNSGWEERVDRIQIFRQGGIAIVTFSTSRPAGTTVYAEANGIKIGNPDGMPFMYEGSQFCNE